MSIDLPPGEQLRSDFPRFGLGKFASRFPTRPVRIELRISGDVEEEATIADEWACLPRLQMVSDFHCVVTSGFCFRTPSSWITRARSG